MIRLYRQTPEGIERTTQVDAAEQHLDSVFWIDLLTPEPAEIKFVERLCGLEMPTYDEMREIEATSRLYTEDGARFMTTTVLSRVDTESPSLSEITFVLMGAKIITIRHSDSYSFRVFSHQLLRQKQISRDQVFTGLLETIVDRQADVLERFGAELDRLSKNIFRRDEPEGKASKRVPVSSALRLTLQDLGRVGDLLTRQRGLPGQPSAPAHVRQQRRGLGRHQLHAVHQVASSEPGRHFPFRIRQLPFQQRQLHAGRRSGPHQHRTERNR